MAILKAIPYLGFNPEYWKITLLSSNYVTNGTKVRIALYANQAARELNTPVPGIQNQLKVTDYDIAGVDHSRDTAYAALKLLEDFAGAEDC